MTRLTLWCFLLRGFVFGGLAVLHCVEFAALLAHSSVRSVCCAAVLPCPVSAVHRHLLQVWPRPLPDLRREAQDIRPHQELNPGPTAPSGVLNPCGGAAGFTPACSCSACTAAAWLLPGATGFDRAAQHLCATSSASSLLVGSACVLQQRLLAGLSPGCRGVTGLVL